MKIARYYKYGSPKNILIEQRDVLDPKQNELLVKVHYTTVNRTDCAILLGKPLIMHLMYGLLKPKLKTLGTDIAGEVIAVGKEVKRFKIGDRIFGFNDMGMQSHSQFTIIKEKYPLAAIPKEINYKEAAASLEGAHYAINFINKVTIKPGNLILVNGASGAIGSAMVQLLIAKGAQVIATSNGEQISTILNYGAKKVIDYTKEDFTKLSKDFDFIFDAVGKSTFFKCKHLLKPKGVYISSELGPYCQNPVLALFSKNVGFPIPTNPQKSISLITEALKSGKLKPMIDSSFKLDEIQEAFTYVLSGKKSGNVVLEIEHD